MSNKKPNITNEGRNLIAQFLLAKSSSDDGKLPHGVINEAAAQFGYTRKTISGIWSKAKQQINAGKTISLCTLKNTKERAKIFKIEFDQARFTSIPKQKRGSFRRIAREMEVSKSTIARWYKDRVIQAHTNAIKPCLTEKNKYSRIRFSLQALEVERNSIIKFNNMQQIVHIDEKWFYLTRANERYYMVEGEEDPYRSCQNKRFITKVMFLCAVARPLYDEAGECVFDGKIGIFPFTHQVAAKRKSKNRAAGTIQTRPLNSITREITKQCLINQVVVIPAIKAKWPIGASKDIFIQQDNAKPHLGDEDLDFRQAVSSDGFNIRIIFQPPNSPDTNINDLGWFRVIQSLQVETASYTIDQLLGAVVSSYHELSHSTLNCVFLTLQSCMVEILKAKGHNNYKIPHMGKERLMRQGILPYVLEIDQILVREVVDYLVQENEAEGMENFITTINGLTPLLI